MQPWRDVLAERLPILGHRNWILVADAAYPEQAAAGIVSVATGEPLLAVLSEVLSAARRMGHVRPVAVLDAELDHLDEALCPGAEAFRTGLGAALEGIEREPVLHEELLVQLSRAAETYTVLVLKTDSVIPYTSVFLRLECGYWGLEHEAALRRKMG